ncbi:hypothetical protein DYB32_004373 [Aphanomyces invadans]|uniref:Uncharacterized protein n=1 Tax=Aphanomyces invadans TaxID=157072 RepID=A0A3R7A9W9_9STRA|nr:hypothetical protein DYB32_004373 [Aphanomyces invadans]
MGVKDHTFYTWSSTAGFSAHKLGVEAGGLFNSTIIKQLCNAEISEYTREAEYHQASECIGIHHPTYDINKAKTVRPNSESQFLSRFSFISNVVVSGKKVALQLIPLAQLRLPTDLQSNPALAAAEKYTVMWFNHGNEMMFCSEICCYRHGDCRGHEHVNVMKATRAFTVA